MKFYVGLTGNIASGKSTIAALFKKMGMDIISADQISKELTARTKPAFKEIVSHFGEFILTEAGELNRRFLRDLIFNDNNERQWIEGLLHPLIRTKIQKDLKKCKSTYCIIEIPLLINRTNYPYLHRILYVFAEPKEQIKRLMMRDASTREQALAILSIQATQLKHRTIADDILINDGTIQHLENQVIKLHEQYLEYAAEIHN